MLTTPSSSSAARSTTSSGTPLDSVADVLAARVLCALNCALLTPCSVEHLSEPSGQSVFANRCLVMVPGNSAAVCFPPLGFPSSDEVLFFKY